MNEVNRVFQSIRQFSIRHHIVRAESWYERNERWLGTGAMLVGVVVDFIAFRRIDLLFDTLVLVGYLVVALFGIVLVNLHAGGVLRGRFFDRIGKWLSLLIQFSFGGLFSAFFVFYIKSASIFTSWPFFLMLLFLLVGNELFREQYQKLTFNISVYFLALFSFAMFYTPVLTKNMGMSNFVLSGFVALAFISVFVYLLSFAIPKSAEKARSALFWSVFFIYIGVNFLYVSRIIPPIPLAFKDSGVYHYVAREGGEYRVIEEKKRWRDLLGRETIHISEGDPVYVYTSVFAPTDLQTPIHHHWQYLDERGVWESADIISYPIYGGRDGGYRGYSVKRAVFPGQWRVDIETDTGHIVGRVRFDIERAEGFAELEEGRL